jgi:hypothetical protein
MPVVVYPGAGHTYHYEGKPFDKGVPTWVKATPVPGKSELRPWQPGDDAREGGPILLTAGADPEWIPMLTGVAMRLREVYPTCPLVVQSGPEFAEVAARIPGVTHRTHGSSGGKWYREYNARKSALSNFCGQRHLEVHPAQDQAIRALGLHGGESPADFQLRVPERGDASGVALLIHGAEDFGVMVADLARAGGVEITIATTAEEVARAAHVVGIGAHPLLWVARALGIPTRALLPAGTPDRILSQFTLDATGRVSETFRYGWLRDAMQAPIGGVMTFLLPAPEAPDGRESGPREVQGGTRDRRKRGWRRSGEDADPDSDGDAPDPDPVP